MTTALALGLCPWCARWLTDNCGHQMPVLGPLERHRIELPYPDYPTFPALSLNSRGSRWSTNAAVQQVRGDVSYLARGIKPGRHVFAHLAWRPKKPGRQDDDNLALLMKACCDAIARGPRRPTLRNKGMAIGLDLVPDDTVQYMTKALPVILPDGPPGMWLTVGVVR
jgi:crossover junction endodeoxyribonuclease RusA